MIQSFFNRVMIPLTVLLIVTGAGVAAFSQRPWAPRGDVEQPIPFSHRIHAGVNKIPCQYCHEYARRSRTSGIPPVSRCVGCHGNMGIGSGQLTPVTRPWSDHSQAPLEIIWNRVYTLPDFVRFTHRPHIKAGVACQECHGPVETMERIVPVYEINMGFCVQCHSQRNVTVDCVVCHH